MKRGRLHTHQNAHDSDLDQQQMAFREALSSALLLIAESTGCSYELIRPADENIEPSTLRSKRCKLSKGGVKKMLLRNSLHSKDTGEKKIVF